MNYILLPAYLSARSHQQPRRISIASDVVSNDVCTIMAAFMADVILHSDTPIIIMSRVYSIRADLVLVHACRAISSGINVPLYDILISYFFPLWRTKERLDLDLDFEVI